MGVLLRDARKKNGMTQTDLSKKSGVSRTTISALEKGIIKNTSTNTLIKLADALGSSVEDIFFARSDQ